MCFLILKPVSGNDSAAEGGAGCLYGLKEGRPFSARASVLLLKQQVSKQRSIDADARKNRVS